MAAGNDDDGASGSSISPMTGSPRELLPSATALKPDAISEALQPSPVRTEQKSLREDATGIRINGHKDSVLSTHPSTTEFPFDAAPGSTGVHPTTDDLVNRIDHALVHEDAAPKPNGTLSAQSTIEATGATTPTRRRSVQFARNSPAELPQTLGLGLGPKQDGVDLEESDPQGKEKPGSKLLSKLKALAAPMSLQSHGRSLSGWTIDSSIDEGMESPPPISPASERDLRLGGGGGGGGGGDTDDAGADAEDEADAEESAPESSGATRARTKKKGRRKMRLRDRPSTAPSTPRVIKLPTFHRSATEKSPTGPSSTPRPTFAAVKNNTMSDIPEHHRLGFSEDEGRDRIRRDGSDKRPSGFRRLTGLAARMDGAAESSLTSWRSRGERTSSNSAQKWRQLKAGLKMLSAKRKEDNRLDHAKSAELMAELLAAAPAALLLASMFQRDEHGRKRIPVLLEQLRVRVTDSWGSKKAEHEDRHVNFRIELEYGSALVRMKWVVHRTWRDFANLHVKYKVRDKSEDIKYAGRTFDRTKLPRFPRGAVPYLRGMRGLFDDDDNEEDEYTAGEQSGPDAETSGTDRPNRLKRARSSFNFVRRTTSALGGESISRLGSSIGALGGNNAGTGMSESRMETYAERIRKRVEEYLQQMITYVIFSPDSNRLCKFLELSALGVRLAAEGGYHGKEGFMIIKSSKGIDFRKSWNPGLFWNRHTPKWFLVRQSYIVCVDSPDQMNVYDVFLVDPSFSIEKLKNLHQDREVDETPLELVKRTKNTATHPSHHQLKIENSERVTKILAKNERHLHQFEDSIKFMLSQTEWGKPHRFGSFAPVRKNAWCQFLVDGQDYMWNASRAISMARDVIYIHDWWLSPELYLRRPAAISRNWRLDRLLKRKADEGVKVFIIMYRNVESAIPIDSTYSKLSLINLSPNISVQRSPNQLRQNTFFWAHHEKILIVDHCVAFCGGVDLCFGRWDTPAHNLTDDKLTGFEMSDVQKDADHCQLWPGKDYSNPRVQDFYALDKPYEEMYDRTKIPRMPWHDVGMQMVGQPARDLSRHFVQRWNFILRQRNVSRPTPMLLPPPDFLPADLEALDLTGSCEIQILRSACEWSLGVRNGVEHSIMNAYVETICDSEHFVYIENQFFITSCSVGDTIIKNEIGDALVERIIRAYRNDEAWRAIIIIPLLPGFQNTVEASDGTSVRLIMASQFSSICRGESSIFERLRKEQVDPEDYIQFYALRQWGKLGPEKSIVTEQLYIHAKLMIVDDRVAIIGSANINERSMLGSRDSEIAAIVRDTDRIPSQMAGEDYEVSRFAHDLRIRLMQEHLGLDVDRIDQELSRHESVAHTENEEESSSPESPSDRITEQKLIKNRASMQDDLVERERRYRDYGSPGSSGLDNMPPNVVPRMNTADLGLPHLSQLPALPVTDDTDIGGPPLVRCFSHASTPGTHPLIADMRLPVITKHCMRDPLNESFYLNTWHTVAENNTSLYRLVFRCMPDNDVRSWEDYKVYTNFFEKFKTAQHNIHEKSEVMPQNGQSAEGNDSSTHSPSPDFNEKTAANGEASRPSQRRRRRRATTKTAPHLLNGHNEPIMLDKLEAEAVLNHVQGNLVLWPYHWLEKEVKNGSWEFTIDHVAPLEIYI